MWLVSQAEELAAIKEMEQAPDRSLGVIAGVIVDSKLSDALRMVLGGEDEEYSKKVRAELFNPEGPLGSFGARIGLAYLLGMVSEAGHRDLQTFKKIRNLFAHYAEQNTFDGQKISALCKNFTVVDGGMLIEQAKYMPGGDPEKAFLIDLLEINQGKIRMAMKRQGDDTTSPKWRFVASAKLFCATLNEFLLKPQELKMPLF